MANQGLASGAIPPAPSFADFRFSTIGQEPPLLKRMTAHSPDLHHHGPSCPSSPVPGDLEYPSTVEPQRALSRPTLLQSLTYSNPSDADATGPNISLAQSVDAQETRSVDLPILPHLQIPASSQQASTASSAIPAPLNAGTATFSSPALSFAHKEQTSKSVSPSEIRTPVVHPVSTTTRQTPLPATTVHQTHCSYAALRALQSRLMTSLSKLHPPDMTDALLRVQSANSYSVNALTTAHRSQILAQQSLATAQEAVAAAQECLNVSEQARTHANDALTAIRQLHSGKAGFDAEGSADWQWKVNYIQLQDDLRMFGEWLVEKENEDPKSGDVDRQFAHTGGKQVAEAKCAVGVSGFDSHVVQNKSSEVSQRVGVIQSRRNAEASRSTPHSDLPLNRNLDHRRSLETQADAATKAWSSEQSHASRGLPLVVTEPEHLPPKINGDMFQEARQPAQSNEIPSLITQHQEEALVRRCEDEARLQAQDQEAHQPELHEKKLEVATFQMMQRERMTSEEPESAVNGSQLKPPQKSTANGITDKPQPPRSKSSAIVEDAKRALQVHKETEVALAEKIEQKRESRRLLEERKQRELADPKKEEEQLTAAQEQVLIAEREKLRQEIMLQKQRATAETAAKINAERAREKEKAMVTSLQSPTSSTPQSSLPDRPTDSGNLVAKKTTISKLTKKSKSLSGGVRLGTATDGQAQLIATSDSLPPPSPALARSAALGLRPLKAKALVNTGPENTKADNVSSRKATPVEKSSQNFSLRTPTPTNGTNGAEDLHVHRHSNDPGNLRVVPRSQVTPASPEAQAVNLRFVKDGNGVRWDALLDLKSDLEHTDQSSLHQNSPVSVKKESSIPALFAGPQIRPPIEPEPPKSVDSSPSCSLPVKPFTSASLPSVRRYPTTIDKDALMDQRGVTGTVPVSSTIFPSSINAIDTSSAASPSNTRRPPSNITPPNPHRDNLSSTWNNSKPLTSKPLNTPLTTPLATLDMTAIDPILPNDATQIAPVIHANGGWDRPVDEDVYSGEPRMREPTPPQRLRQLRRGGDHYSPPPRAPTPNTYASRGYAARSISPITRSPVSPAQRSPVLGKRRQREDVREDEHPPRRQWPTDGTRRTRSPPPHFRQSIQQRSASPDRPALQARMQGTDHPDISRARLPPSRELAWRSPSPDRPALQARIGVRNPTIRAVNGGQSYRPTYPSGTYERPQSRGRDNYQSRPADPAISGHRLGAEPELRGPSYNRSRGSMNNHRGSPRGRGNRGGNRPLNLEQRISSSAKSLTLINRLESPLRD